MGAYGGNRVILTAQIKDISTASAVRIPIVDDMEGKVEEVSYVLGGAIVGDAILTVSKNGTALNGGVTTITASGSGEGDTYSANPHLPGANAANEFYAGDYIQIATDGASTNTVPVGIMIRIKR